MSELPEGWTEVKLGELLEPERGIFDGPFGSSLKTADYVDDGVRVVRLENVATFEFVDSKRTWISFEKFDSLRKHEVNAGDLIVGSFVDEKLRVCLLPQLDTPAIAKADCFCLRPRDAIVDRRFLMYQLGLDATRDALVSEIHGATRPRITTKQLKEVSLKLPPLAEQRRIVEKVEALLAHAREGREAGSHATSLIERLRQSLFSAAVNGDLTAEWRNRHRAGPWRVVRAAEVCARVQSGGTPKAGFTSSGIPFLKVYNIVHQRVDFCRSQFVTRELHQGVLGKSIAYPGDVIMNIVGPPLGKVAIVPRDYPEWNINQALTLFRSSSEITSDWLYILLAEGRNTAEVLKDTKGIVGQVNISLSQCRNFEFVLPSVPEQHEIEHRLRGLLSLLERAKARVISTVTRLETLTSSVLTKAFSGEFVPTEAELARREGRTYEPPSIFLKRILTERDCVSPAEQRRRRSGPSSARRDAPSVRR